jgi:hypothetical protein
MGAILPLYRVRGVILTASVIVIFASMLARALIPGVPDALLLATLLGVVGMALAGLLILIGPRLLPKHPVVSVSAPVRGRWLAVNSPSTKVPSHGVRAYGQAYAVDLVLDPEDGSRPQFGPGPTMRAADEYPAFGEPVLAMVSGEVVTVSDDQRDHRARSNWFGLFYMFAEGAVRELGGPRFIVGNHVVIRSDDGMFALVAHLRRGSAVVSRGDRVTAGQPIAACGNTGNSTEPHVHAQLMDRASPLTGQGIPMDFDGVPVPADGQHLAD